MCEFDHQSTGAVTVSWSLSQTNLSPCSVLLAPSQTVEEKKKRKGVCIVTKEGLIYKRAEL